MKVIRYKRIGARLVHGPDGGLIRKPLEVVVELPYSESNMKKAEANAVSGSLQILTREDHDLLHSGKPAAAQPRICLEDRTTGEIYEVYIDAGKLMMEVL